MNTTAESLQPFKLAPCPTAIAAGKPEPCNHILAHDGVSRVEIREPCSIEPSRRSTKILAVSSRIHSDQPMLQAYTKGLETLITGVMAPPIQLR